MSEAQLLCNNVWQDSDLYCSAVERSEQLLAVDGAREQAPHFQISQAAIPYPYLGVILQI